ncbi:carboxypeptidase regulatory-like domain-containing protein [Candidatus Sumerlaeota bacterium]|nr:carboxypeptidase regulatory-like domain-containing protein [Candidatus Sumerlaeota bacterium]
MKQSHVRNIHLWIILALFVFSLCSCGDKSETASITKTSGRNKPPTHVSRGVINGKVLTPDLQDHSGILVYAVGKSLMVYADSDGEYSFLDVPEGSYEFKAKMEGYVTASLGTVTINSSEEASIQTIEIPLMTLEKSAPPSPEQNMGDLIGKVEIETGDEATGVLVQILGTLYKTVTDEQGVYRFFNLPGQTYTLRFSRAGYISQTTTISVIGGEPVFAGTIRIEPLVEPQKFRRIYGSVEMYDLKGNLTNKFGNVIVALEGTSYVSLPDGQGKFLFDKISPARYTITSTAPGFQNRNKIEVDLADLEYTNASVILDEIPPESAKFAIIRGLVTLEKQEDHSGVAIALTGTSIVSISDEQGRYMLNNVPEGVYTALAQMEGYVPMIIQNVQAEPGEEIELETINMERRVAPPEVVYTDPGDGQSEVMIQKITPLYVRFNKKMNPDSVKRAFSISPAVEYRIFAGRQHHQSDFDLLYVELMGNSEANPLLFDTPYAVNISALATDFENISMKEDYQFSFSTGKPSITGAIPEVGEKHSLVNLQHPILVFFNASIDPGTVVDSMIAFNPAPEVNPYFRIHNDPETGWSTLRIFVQLAPGTRYTLRLASGIRTESDAYISNLPFMLTFTTAELRNVNEMEPRY